ncbi:uncharacterized protein [Watersipora subatra]|uniref:uncharacterized protein isoform X2 n=1 Tax=Watersipora subatra TaxID=2589382 RepID=UPI00355C3F09
MSTQNSCLLDEEMDLVESSPASEKKVKYLTVEEEALKLADYLLKSRAIKAEDDAATDTDDDSDMLVPTANLLPLTPTPICRRKHRRTMVTQELQDMFGFEATPLPRTKPKTRRRLNPEGATQSEERASTLQPIGKASAITELGNGIASIEKVDDEVRGNVTGPNKPAASGVAAGRLSTRRQSQTTTQSQRKASATNKPAVLNNPKEKLPSASTRRVTRGSVPITRPKASKPTEPVISTNEGDSAVRSRQNLQKAKMIAAPRRVAQAKVDSGRKSAAPKNPAITQLDTIASKPQTSGLKDSQTSFRLPSTKKTITSKIDTGQHSKKNIACNSKPISRDQQFSRKAVKGDPMQALGAARTPSHTLGMVSNNKCNTVPCRTPRTISSNISDLTLVAGPTQTPVSTRIPPRQQSLNTQRPNHSQFQSRLSTSANTKSLKIKSENTENESTMFKRPPLTVKPTGKKSVANVSTKGNQPGVTQRRSMTNLTNRRSQL